MRVRLEHYAWIQFIFNRLGNQFWCMLLRILRLLECSNLAQKVLADGAFLLLHLLQDATRIVHIILPDLMHHAPVTLDHVFHHGRFG